MKAIQERGFLSGYNRYVWAVIVLQVAGGLVSPEPIVVEACMHMDGSIDRSIGIRMDGCTWFCVYA